MRYILKCDISSAVFAHLRKSVKMYFLSINENYRSPRSLVSALAPVPLGSDATVWRVENDSLYNVILSVMQAEHLVSHGGVHDTRCLVLIILHCYL